MCKTPLDKYLDDLQDDAMNVSSMLEGAALLNNEGTREATNAAYAIIEVVVKMADELAAKLDSTVRPAAEEERT